MDPATGATVVVQADAAIQERDLRLDDAEAAAALRRRIRQLDGRLEDRNEREMVKAEIMQEIEDIEEFQRKHFHRVASDAQRAVRTVRMAIKRFHQKLASTLDANGRPHAVLIAFSQHIERHIILPSARFASLRGTLARTGLAGCFTYEPPAGVAWCK
jgi:hypothetical protein